MEMDRMDTRRAVRFNHGIHYGWHWRNVYHHRRKLAGGCDGLRLRHHRGATCHADVSNRSHNGSQIVGHMKILTHILAGSAPVIALVMALQLDAQADQIAKLTLDRDTAQAKAINARNDADFQRTRCDAFYDVVGDYIDVTNQLKALD